LPERPAVVQMSPGCWLALPVLPLPMPAPVWQWLPPSGYRRCKGHPSHLCCKTVRASFPAHGSSVTHRRGPVLCRPDPVSSLRRTPPPPARLRPISRGRRLDDLPGSAACAAGRGGLLQVRDPSWSPCCHGHPVGGTDRLSQGASRPAACAPSVAGSASEVAHLRGHVGVRWRYGPVPRCHPADGVVDGLQRCGFPPPCHPSYQARACPLAGLTPAGRVRLRWTHNGAGAFRRTPLSSVLV
jgi:hypothetical protein